MTQKIFYVATRTQAAIFELELKGQISDGHWENSLPHNHWHAPHEAEVVVRPESVGRNFPHMRGYLFGEADLVSCVGDREINYAKAALAFPELTIAQLLTFRFLLDGSYGWHMASTSNSSYDANREKFTEATGVKTYAELKTLLDAVNYTGKNLKKDLTALTMAFRKVVNDKVAVAA